MPPGKPKMPCPKCKAMMKQKARFCGKCGTPMTVGKAAKPTPGDGVTGAAAAAIQPVPAHREPDGPAFEALEHDAGLPTVPDASVKTAMRLSQLRVPADQGMIHGLLCPAYDETSVKAAWPGADLSLVDEMTWQAKALEIAATAPLDEAMAASRLWETARMVKAVAPDLAADIMGGARKAFRDANPGPGKAPEPGEMSAERYNRPYIGAGHAAPSPGQDPPHSSPIHPGHVSASDFTRPLITAGHAADSPDNAAARPAPVPAPEVPGVPSRVFYSNAMRQNAAQAMAAMHDHIAATFPDLCPMHGPGRMGQPPAGARPVATGVGGPVPHGASKADEGGWHSTGVTDPVIIDPSPAVADRAAKKAARRFERELLASVLKGDVSIDAARAQLGLPASPAPAVVKAAATELPGGPGTPGPRGRAGHRGDHHEGERPAAGRARRAAQDHRRDRRPARPGGDRLQGRGRRAPRTPPAPAGPTGMSQRAGLAQDATYRAMHYQWRNDPDPGKREHALGYLMGVTGLIPQPPA